MMKPRDIDENTEEEEMKGFGFNPSMFMKCVISVPSLIDMLYT